MALTASTSSSSVTQRPDKKVLSDLKASILNPALTSHFQCWFSPPAAVRASLPSVLEVGDDRLWSLSCSEAALPGSSLATHELTNDHTGVTERHAYRRQYDSTSSFTFYVDHDYKIISFFEGWIDYIVNDINVPDENYFYRVNFPKQYQTTIYINKFERDHGEAFRYLQYKFLKAYPLSIDTMPVTYGTSDLLKCTINFNFSRYIKSFQYDSHFPFPDSNDSFPGIGVPTINEDGVVMFA